jgi:transcriptional regulator GlxA family with amidase domain
MNGTATFVIYEGFSMLDMAGPYEVLADSGYELRVVASDAGPVRSSNGLTVDGGHPVATADLRATDTLVVVGGAGVFAARSDRRLVDWIAVAAASARRVVSVCNGAFLLAETGALDGHRVTTHWRQAERLAKEYPAIVVDSDPIYIRDGRFWTSAGVTSGMDLALALVETDLGPRPALDVARELVLFMRRPGSQSQFSVPLWSTQPSSDALRRVVEGIHSDPGARHGIEDLAERAGWSARHLQRRFTSELGLPPASYVERVRVEAAQRALTERNDPLETIARRCGFGTAETLRRTFHRLVGIAPSDYRARFRTTSEPLGRPVPHQ